MNLYNNIKSHFELPDAFTDWENYRNTLTDYLISETNQFSLPLTFRPGMQKEDLLPTLAIIGAGACNDLDLQALSPHFSKITLMDYDTAAMKKALSAYCLKNNPVIELLPASVNGLGDSDFRQFCEQLQCFARVSGPSLSWEHFSEYALSLLNLFYEKSRQTTIPLLPASYDYIWCFGVHSQLQAMFAYICHAFEVNLHDTFSKNSSCSDNRIFCRLSEENNYFIPKFNDALLASARCAVFIGCEQEKNNDGEPIEGACQAIHDIQNRNVHLKESLILWPFYPAKHISYKMLIQKVTL